VNALSLKGVTIRDFRSIRGTIFVPLDAPVVLIHAPNGAGKTSVMTAIELALTGQSATLRRTDAHYLQHLVHMDAVGSEITIKSRTAEADEVIHTVRLPSADGALGYLDPEASTFFSERCYLAQSTLSRLLEIYEASDTGTDSPLTRFVNELLRLDRYDALIDGLQALGDIRNVRKLVPEYGAAERLLESARNDVAENVAALGASADHVRELRLRIADLARQLGAPSALADPALVSDFDAWLASDSDDREFVRVAALRQEASVLSQRLLQLRAAATDSDASVAEGRAKQARDSADAWLKDAGARLETQIRALRDYFPDLPSVASTDPVLAFESAYIRVETELDRCNVVLEQDGAATTMAEVAQAAVQAAEARRALIDDQLAASASGDYAASLAAALASILPLVQGDDCPVCGRAFKEVSDQPLAAHISSELAGLTQHAQQLQALSAARLEALNDASVQGRRLAELRQKMLAVDQRAQLRSRSAHLVSALQSLGELRAEAQLGSGLLRGASEAQQLWSELREQTQGQVDIESSIRTLGSTVLAASADLAPAAALKSIEDALDAALASVRERVEVRTTAKNEVTQLRAALEAVRDRAAAEEKARTQVDDLERTLALVNERREAGRSVASAATESRTAIVREVFNDALNAVWRDLFVRLAPAEPFVPAFRIPADRMEAQVARLETVTRSGERSGSPGMMLSAGNLNTAALTLFLALHMSAPAQLPWLLLDDPVQSMDDVHIAQFAALLRTLSKEHTRHVIMAVHERALFEYLTLELSPAFPGDQLLTVELSRSPGAESTAEPTYYNWEIDVAFPAAS
jgi:DNA repair protein SbcC/Rad50